MPNGYNTIIETIKTDDLQLFQSLVHVKSQYINKIQLFFQFTCQYNSIKILNYLFKLNPKIHIRDKDDLAFKLACKGGNLQIMKILYEKNNNINIEKILLDFLPSNYKLYFKEEVNKLLFNKIQENKSVNKLQDVAHKICTKIIKMHYDEANEYLINNIIDKYIHLLDIYALCKITIEHNQLYILYKFINYLDDNKIAKLLQFSLQKITIERYDIIEYLMDNANNDVANDLYEYLKNSCKNGDQKFVEIMLLRFNCNSIRWMLPNISYIACYYRHINIVDYIFSYYPNLLTDVKEIYQNGQTLHFASLYYYLNSKLNLDMFEIVISICDEKCPVCLEQHDTYIKTKCGHIFGEKCIQEWISYGNLNCPYCRGNLL
jgi:hypothetical protein